MQLQSNTTRYTNITRVQGSPCCNNSVLALCTETKIQAALLVQDMRFSIRLTVPKRAIRLKATAMLMQLGMMVHLRPSLSATNDAGKTTIKFNTAIAENVAPMSRNFTQYLSACECTCLTEMQQRIITCANKVHAYLRNLACLLPMHTPNSLKVSVQSC